MEYEVFSHYEMLLLTPALGITAGECDDSNCDATHWRLSLSWLFWTGEVCW